MSEYPGDPRAAAELTRARIELAAARQSFRIFVDARTLTPRQRDFAEALERAIGEISVAEAIAALQDLVTDGARG